MAFITQYWPILLVALIIGAVTGYFYFKPRQRVRLSEATPIRPHMTQHTAHNGVADETVAVTGEVASAIMGGRHHDERPGMHGEPDDLLKLKGVGPRFVELLHKNGIYRYDQIAKLSAGQVEQLDEAMGAFRGRIVRDRIVEQADYLARGDVDGYQQKFGAL